MIGVKMSVEGAGRGVRGIAALGLVVAAVGIVLQRAAGVSMPLVPPGLVLLVVAAALTVFVRWRWAPAFGVLVAVMEAIALGVGGADDLVNSEATGVMLATWVRAIGVVVALVAGVASLRSPARVAHA
ncbi:hypothetical protein [Asanoa siamensis]|nr:hypothetical protein [Asanoa siamensis]